MRAFVLVPLLFAAACGGGETEQNKSATKAASLTPGQYEMTSEVTAFQTVGPGEPQINTPVGTRTTEMVCVESGRQFPTALFAGEGYGCRYDNYYVRNGRMNATMMCTRNGLTGSIPITADGRFEAESFEYSRDLRTVLAGEGDVAISARVTGRRAGECPPEGAETNESKAG